MKRTLTIFGALAVAIIPVYLAYYLNRNEADVKYTLFERIPVNFPNVDEKLSGSVQQLEVRNIGNAEAKRVVVKISGEVTAHRIEKISEADEVKTFQQGSNFELIYPEVPAQSGFRFIFISSGRGIEYRDVVVMHSAGKASEALATKATGAFDYVLTGQIILYFILIAWSFRKMLLELKKDRIKLDAKLKKVDDLWEREQPIYAKNKEWRTIFRETIENQIKEDYSSDLKSSLAYSILSSDKPKDFDEATWNSFIDKSMEFISKSFIAEANSSLYNHRITELLKTVRPKHFPQEVWNELIEKVSEKYISNVKTSYRLHETPEGLLRALREDKPQGISNKHWSEYIEYLHKQYALSVLNHVKLFYGSGSYLKELQKERPKEIPTEYWSQLREGLSSGYYQTLYAELDINSNPLQFIKEKDLSYLGPKAKTSLEEQAYRRQMERMGNVAFWGTAQAAKFLKESKPEWMRESDYTALKERAENIIKLENEQLRYAELKSLIKKIIDSDFIPNTKPEKLTDEEWDKIKKLEFQVKDLRSKEMEARRVYEESQEETAKLLDEKSQMIQLKERIEWQLEIIDKVFTDPTILEKIEDYSNSFATGNFENLKKIALLLSQAQDLDVVRKS